MNPWQSAAESYEQGLQGLGQVQQGAYREMANAPLKLYQMFMEGYEKANERKRLEQMDKIRQQQFERQQMLAEETLRHNRETEDYNRQRTRAMERQKSQDEAIAAFMKYNARVGGSKGLVEELFKRAGMTVPSLPELETADNAGAELPGPIRPGEEPLRVEGENPLSGYGPEALAKATEQYRKEQVDKENAIRNAKTSAYQQGRLEDSQKRTENAAVAAARAAGLQASRGEVKESGGKLVLVNPHTGAVTELKDSTGKPLAGKPGSGGMRMPAAVQKDMLLLDEVERLINRAESELKAWPKAIGTQRAIQGRLGDWLNQRTDPKGVKARAAIADLTSSKLKERAGTAQTKQEITNLLPMTVNFADTPEAAFTKLAEAKAGVRARKEAIRKQYAGGGPVGSGDGTDRQSRYNQLRKDGMSPEEAKQKLAEEGY